MPHQQNTQQNFTPTEKKLLVWVELSQHRVKQEAAGAEVSYSSSPTLAGEDNPAAGTSCLSWQPELPEELGQGQEQGPGAVSPFPLS